MRIAYVSADAGVPVFGRKGCSVHVQELVRAFRSSGAHVELFAASVGGPPPPGFESLPVRRLPPVADGEPPDHAAAVAAANRELAVALDRAGPYDLVYERYSLWSFAGMEHARAAGIPGLLEVNAPLIEEQAAYRELRDPAGAASAAARAFRAAALCLAVSAEVAAWLERDPSVRAGGGRVHVLPNGVDPERFRPDVPAAAPGPPGTFTVGFVGSMKPWHGLPVLLDAFALLHQRQPATRLLLVGDGPQQPALRTDLGRRGLTRVACLAGPVAPGAVPGFLTSMDIAVAPYADARRFYFSPLKVYEYLAAGRAVVASRVGQLEAVIQDGVTGLLCPPGDAAALAAALERLLREPELRARFGRAARASVLQSHTWEGVASTVLQLAAAHRAAGTRVDPVEA